MQPAQPAEGLTRTLARGVQRPSRPLGPDVSADHQRLAGDLHDAVLQTLFAASLVTGSLSRHDALPDEARAHTLALQRLNQGALAGMRMLMLESRPEALASARLTELLQQASAVLAARGEVHIESQFDPEDPPATQRVDVYRIAQEALSNVARHSAARHVQLQWCVPAPHHGRLVVADDGHGFDAAAARARHAGLDRMREHAARLQGQLALHSLPGVGTRLQLDFDWA